jgi:DNA-binding MarR family transcriptional regulator
MKRLFYQVISAAATLEQAGLRVLRPIGLTPMTFNILNVLKDGPLSQREIGDRMIVAASSITFQMKQLQRRGLIQRKRADARTWRVSLTEKGEALRAAADHRMDEVIASLDAEASRCEQAAEVLSALEGQLAERIEAGSL